MRISAINNNLYTNFGAQKQRLSIKQMEAESSVKTLSEIKFKDGIAKDKRKNYTGIVKDTINDGKDITFYFQNGRLIASQADNTKKLYFRDDKNKITSIDTRKDGEQKESSSVYFYNNMIITSNIKQLSEDVAVDVSKTTYLNGIQKTKTFYYSPNNMDKSSKTIITIENKDAKKIEITEYDKGRKATKIYYMEKDKKGNIISIIPPAKDGKFYEIDHIEIKRKPNGEIKGIKRTNNASDDVLLDFSLKHPKVFKG